MTVRQPNSRHCFVCGVANPFGLHLNFYEPEPGQVTAELTVPDPYQSYPGVVHGGVVAALLDEAAGRSMMGGSPPRFLYTARLNVTYRKNVPIGRPIRVVGTAGKSKGRTATAASAIYDTEGTLLAEADALMVDIPEEVIGGVDLDAIGWKVYDE